MRISRLILGAMIVAALPALAQAQAQYTAQDIVGHFKPEPAAAAAPDCPEGSVCLPKKGTRAVCIGTGSACAGQQVATAPKADGFDLLITFELGSDTLSAQARTNLEQFAAALKDPALADAVFNVDGHTDARGPADFNEGLSQRRAEAVVQYLESLGVPRSRLAARGFGPNKPRDASDPFAPINRRVEATIGTR